MAEQQTRRDLAITIKARVNGFDCEISFDGAIDQLPAVTRRLTELGAEPVAPALAHGSNSPMGETKPRAQRVAPAYNGDGSACCPVHNTPLSQGQFGLYCSSKAKPGESANAKGYCNLRFES